MKTIRIILLICIFLSIGIGIFFFDDITTFYILGGTLAIALLLNLFGGYFLFKPSSGTFKWKKSAILNGIAIALNLFMVIFKLLINVQPLYPNILFILPTVIMLMYYLYRFFNTQKEKKYFSHIITYNISFCTLTTIILVINGLTFSQIIYGKQSSFHLSAKQTKLLNKAIKYNKKSDYNSSKPILNKAISISESINDTRSQNYQACIIWLGHTQYMLGEYEKADSLYNVILKLYSKTDLESYPTSKIYYNVLYKKALLHSNWEGYKLSDSLLHLCLPNFTHNIKIADIHQTLGNNQKNRGHFHEADSLYNLAIQHHKKVWFDNNSNFVYTLVNKADNYIDNNKFNAADSILNYSYSFTAEKFGSNSKELTYILDTYVRLNIILGKYKIAERYCLENLGIKESNKNQRYMESVLNLASIYMSLSYYYEADKVLRKNLLIVERDFYNNSPILNRFYNLMTQHHINLLDYDIAGEYCAKSINTVKKYYGNHTLIMASAYDNLGEVFLS